MLLEKDREVLVRGMSPSSAIDLRSSAAVRLSSLTCVLSSASGLRAKVLVVVTLAKSENDTLKGCMIECCMQYLSFSGSDSVAKVLGFSKGVFEDPRALGTLEGSPV